MANKKAETSAKKNIKVAFLKSPTGDFGMAYNVGDVVELPAAQAEILLDKGYAKKA